MSKIKATAKKLVDETNLNAARGENDTIRLWENYRDQSSMWRSLTLLQIPATTIAILFAGLMWMTRSVTLEVPSKPLPGIYAAQDIPDTEFVNVATEYVNLVATYNPVVSRKQFELARAMLKEPLITKFKDEMIDIELRAIESTSRTQAFFVDPAKTKIERIGNEVKVSLVGERWKSIAGQEVPIVTSQYTVTMTTLPRNILNPYGIVISSVDFVANIYETKQ